MSSNGNQIPSHSPGISEFGIRVTVHAQVMSLIILESCHCTWIFDSRHLRFCQIFKDLEVGDRRASTEWRPYWDLQINRRQESFTVCLNESRSRLIWSSLHKVGCADCGGDRMIELSMEDIHRAVA
jgi:hypothetical protein